MGKPAYYIIFLISFLNRIRIRLSMEKEAKRIAELLEKAVKENIPNEKFGILFSGGIDSTFIAHLCKKFGKNFVCYTAGLKEKGIKKAADIEWAEKVSKEMGFKLKKKEINLKELEGYVKKIVPIIHSANVVKVGVAVPLFLACEMAKKDNVKFMFSGLGSEEIFAGYERHEKSDDINEECRKGLENIEERDLERDRRLSSYNNIGLKIPFLHKELVDYALKIPGSLKIKGNIKKYILRQAAIEEKIPEEFAFRKKKAAQYGSNFDKGLAKLAKREGMKKSEYLMSLTVPIGALVSSGKDSIYAIYKMLNEGYKIKCFITLKSRNPESYMFHTINNEMVDLQAEAMGLPLVRGFTEGEKEDELADLRDVINKAKREYGIKGIVTGALFSDYQRERIEKICKDESLTPFSPLWHKDQETEMRELIKNGFEVIFTAIAAEGLDKSWLNRKITQKDVDRLVGINEKIGINVAGEGGEFESLVLDCPLFMKRIEIIGSEIMEERQNIAGLKIKKAVLKQKP